MVIQIDINARVVFGYPRFQSIQLDLIWFTASHDTPCIEPNEVPRPGEMLFQKYSTSTESVVQTDLGVRVSAEGYLPAYFCACFCPRLSPPNVHKPEVYEFAISDL